MLNEQVIIILQFTWRKHMSSAKYTQAESFIATVSPVNLNKWCMQLDGSDGASSTAPTWLKITNTGWMNSKEIDSH